MSGKNPERRKLVLEASRKSLYGSNQDRDDLFAHEDTRNRHNSLPYVAHFPLS